MGEDRIFNHRKFCHPELVSGSVAILKNLTVGKKMLNHLPAVTASLTELAKEWQFRQEFSMTE
jgi:hypothetical protein